jgi:hypothetical protein
MSKGAVLPEGSAWEVFRMGKRFFVPITAVAAAGLLLAVMFLVMRRPARAQRHVSPEAAASVTIAGKKISVDYYAPSMYGRKIMGGLVPFNQVWCTGANYATAITSDADLTFGSVKVPAGRFSIWTIPTPQDWTLILNKQTGQSHLYYDESRDIGRTQMNVKALLRPVETFRIELRPGANNTGTLALIWEQTEASIPFTVGK